MNPGMSLAEMLSYSRYVIRCLVLSTTKAKDTEITIPSVCLMHCEDFLIADHSIVMNPQESSEISQMASGDSTSHCYPNRRLHYCSQECPVTNVIDMYLQI